MDLMAGTEPPAVLLYHHSTSKAGLREIAAGLEEEGVPLRALPAAAGDAAVLAQAAAEVSRLGVGIGMANDVAAVTVRGAGGRAVFTERLEDGGGLRRLGQNAARAVKGTVFACRL